jgi:hypothetical protein
MRTIEKCLPNLIQDEEAKVAVDSVNLDKKIIAFIIGLNAGILTINLTPGGFIRLPSLVFFSILILVVTIQSIYHFGQAQLAEDALECALEDNKQSPMDKLQSLISLMWGYLGVGIGLLFGLLIVNGMASFSTMIQLRVLLCIGCVQMIMVNVLSIRTYNKCVEAEWFETASQSDKDFLNTFKSWQQPSIGIASLIFIAVLVSFYFFPQ